ncbi:hypothetical protein SAMN05421882_100386 [Nitrosomonas communis]|uniref:Uncharacterized protein n=2 Tax=Nitrosomonas communis TaxID=44574 RepID=A0A1H2QZR3_9PROT|nr:hypothetical protein SAMN05421882_100386 [Nitrosomonas communis]
MMARVVSGKEVLEQAKELLVNASTIEELIQAHTEWQLRRMFQDEARFGRVSDTSRCGCPKPVRPLCQAIVT